MRLGKARVFLFLCLAFLLGVAIAKFISLEITAVLAVIFIILISVFWVNNITRLVGFLGLIMLLGVLRFNASFPNDKANFIGKLYGQKVEIEGVVVREPDVRSDKVNLTVRPLPYSLPRLVSDESERAITWGGKLLSPGDGERWERGRIEDASNLSLNPSPCFGEGK